MIFFTLTHFKWLKHDNIKQHFIVTLLCLHYKYLTCENAILNFKHLKELLNTYGNPVYRMWVIWLSSEFYIRKKNLAPNRTKKLQKVDAGIGRWTKLYCKQIIVDQFSTIGRLIRYGTRVENHCYRNQMSQIVSFCFWNDHDGAMKTGLIH